MQKGTSVLRESNGRLSSMRIMAMIWVLGLTIAFTMISIQKGELIEIPWSLVAVTTALVTGKAVQKFAEK